MAWTAADRAKAERRRLQQKGRNLSVNAELQAIHDNNLLLYKNNILAFIRMMGAEPTLQQILFIQDAIASRKSRTAVKSCTSSGKTACLAWLILWAIAVEDDVRILATAPTYPLLNRVLRTEVQKWFLRMPEIMQDIYVMTNEAVKRKGNLTHRCDFATANADNEQALAGGHSSNYWVIVDEGSAVADDVYEVLLGTLSYGSGGRLLITSNPTRSSGFYYDLFIENNPFWKLHTFTAFDSPHVTQEYIDEMATTYGEDHDFYRVRILGEFPKASSTQYITTAEVKAAKENQLMLAGYHHYPKVAGVDVARFGDDDTVFVTRQGPKLLDITRFKGLNTMEVAGHMLEYYQQWQHASVFVDGVGLGAGVVDRGRDLGVPVVDVLVSNKSSNPAKYVNMKSQLWGSMKDWLNNGADIPNDQDLSKQLIAMEYGYNQKLQIQLMGKKEIKKRHGFSPDIPDSIALTFAEDAFLTLQKGAPSRRARNVQMGSYLWA
jgi:hypothetical protein